MQTGPLEDSQPNMQANTHAKTQTAARAHLIERYLAAYNAFDIDGMLALLTADVRFENWSNGQLTVETSGIDAFAQLAQQSKGLFSQREQRITSCVQNGAAAIVGIAYRGTLAMDIPDGPPARTVLDLTGASEFTFQDGLIARIVDRS